MNLIFEGILKRECGVSFKISKEQVVIPLKKEFLHCRIFQIYTRTKLNNRYLKPKIKLLTVFPKTSLISAQLVTL